MRNLSIIVVEDDTAACDRFVQCANEIEEVSIVSLTNSASKAIEDIHDYQPDVIILDLELHYGSGTGLDVLMGLKQIQLPTKPYILITTNNSSQITFDYARTLGADFIMSKHQDHYSETKVLSFIAMMKNLIFAKQNSTKENTNTETPKQKEKRMIRWITSELDAIGISPKAVGYKYLIDAIYMYSEDNILFLCNKIGEIYGKSESSVERAMQNAIHRAWKKADIEDLLKHYTAKVNSEKGCPTIKEFICYYAKKLKYEF